MVSGQLGRRGRIGGCRAERLARGGLASTVDRRRPTQAPTAGGRGVRRRRDLLPHGGRGGVPHPADQRPRRPGQGGHRDRRPHQRGGGRCRWTRPRHEIDYWVDRYDPAAVRRTEDRARGRHADVRKPEDGSGTADIEARLLATRRRGPGPTPGRDGRVRCATTIRAPWISVAPMRWAPSGTAPTAWRANARIPMRGRRYANPARWSSTSSPTKTP